MIDVLDVDGALLDAGAAVGAGPQDVGVDDPAFLLGADERPVDLRLTGLGNPPEARLGHVVGNVLRRRFRRTAGGRAGLRPWPPRCPQPPWPRADTAPSRTGGPEDP